MRASFLEIYNEEVRDLLSKNPKNKLDLKERKDQGVYVKGLNSFVVKSVAEITSVLEVSRLSSRIPSSPACLPTSLLLWLSLCSVYVYPFQAFFAKSAHNHDQFFLRQYPQNGGGHPIDCLSVSG